MNAKKEHRKREWDWFDKPKNRHILRILLWSACGISVVLEFFVDRHPHFQIDSFHGSFALIGFVSCAAFILIAKFLGIFLKAPEDYYDDE